MCRQILKPSMTFLKHHYSILTRLVKRVVKQFRYPYLNLRFLFGDLNEINMMKLFFTSVLSQRAAMYRTVGAW